MTRKRRAITLIEMIVVIVVSSFLIIFIYKSMDTTRKQLRIAVNQNQILSESLTVINRIEDMLTGCESVTVETDKITVIRDGVSTVYGTDDIKSEVVFVRDGDNIIVDLGGEQYCIPIILKE